VYSVPALCETREICSTSRIRNSSGTVSSQTERRLHRGTGVEPPIPGLTDVSSACLADMGSMEDVPVDTYYSDASLFG
jgi:hypothetical protein